VTKPAKEDKVAKKAAKKAAKPAPSQRSRARRPAASPGSKLPAYTGPKVPAAQRVFTAALLAADAPYDHVLGAHQDELYAWDPQSEAELWRVKGPGVVQRLVVGDIGGGRRLYVAWGIGRGFLRVPLVLQALDPKTGVATELWRHPGARAECAHLSIADVDRDRKDELAFAYYHSKYFVRTRHLQADGSVIEGPDVRMASSRTYGDLDRRRGVDEVVGRVYGDEKGMPGDLKVDLGKGPQRIPTFEGVKAVLFARLDGKRPTLLFADGWVSNYGREGKARLQKLTYEGGKPKTEVIGRSSDEFTFFNLFAVDVDGDGRQEVVAQGSKRVSLFTPSAAGPWARRTITPLPPVLNIAVGRLPKGGVAVYIPGARTRQVPLKP